jgi:hypothetical protein
LTRSLLQGVTENEWNNFKDRVTTDIGPHWATAALEYAKDLEGLIMDPSYKKIRDELLARIQIQKSTLDWNS